jgi:hypothetical protein
MSCCAHQPLCTPLGLPVDRCASSAVESACEARPRAAAKSALSTGAADTAPEKIAAAIAATANDSSCAAARAWWRPILVIPLGGSCLVLRRSPARAAAWLASAYARRRSHTAQEQRAARYCLPSCLTSHACCFARCACECVPTERLRCMCPRFTMALNGRAHVEPGRGADTAVQLYIGLATNIVCKAAACSPSGGDCCRRAVLLHLLGADPWR